jgi:hypothetical protein
VTRAERRIVEELLDAGEALRRSDGDLGRPEVFRGRWERFERALAEGRTLLPAPTSTTPPAGATT